MEGLDQMSSAHSSSRWLRRFDDFVCSYDYCTTKLSILEPTICGEVPQDFDAGFNFGNRTLSCSVRDHSGWSCAVQIAICDSADIKHRICLVTRNDRDHEKYRDGLVEKLALVLHIIFAIILAAAVGPSSTILMIPRPIFPMLGQCTVTLATTVDTPYPSRLSLETPGRSWV